MTGERLAHRDATVKIVLQGEPCYNGLLPGAAKLELLMSVDQLREVLDRLSEAGHGQDRAMLGEVDAELVAVVSVELVTVDPSERPVVLIR